MLKIGIGGEKKHVETEGAVLVLVSFTERIYITTAAIYFSLLFFPNTKVIFFLFFKCFWKTRNIVENATI